MTPAIEALESHTLFASYAASTARELITAKADVITLSPGATFSLAGTYSVMLDALELRRLLSVSLTEPEPNGSRATADVIGAATTAIGALDASLPCRM